MAVQYFDIEVRSGLTQKRKLSSFLQNLVHQHLEVKKVSLSYIFCSDEYLLEKNIEFLNHDTYTDIITFDLSENENDLAGEIYISTDRVKENAEKFAVNYQWELHRVIFHGALHLCGFKDKKKEEKALMTEMENKCLQEYFTA